MKTFTPALTAHYASDSTRLATCWKATLVGGDVIAATSHDVDLLVDGVLYKAANGYRVSDVATSSQLNPDNLELDGMLQSPAITDADVHSGRWDYAAIEIFEINYTDLTGGKNILRSGTLGEVKSGRNQFTAELRGLMQAYSRVIVRLTTKDCTADLGDARCTVNVVAITVAGVVDSVVANRQILDATRVEAAHLFTGGLVTFTSGLNNGLSMEVKVSAVGSLTLHEQMAFVIAPGDTYTVYPGCTKRFNEDCITKFNNGVNFRGFPHLPGVDIYKAGGV
jgi:uncharacterized phage protein (TIGR02218 family)